MNERIGELAKEAGLLFQCDKLSYEEQKFAELIVRECMSNLYLHGYDDARAQIKEHFGVEE